MSPRVCLSSLPQHKDYKPATTPGLTCLWHGFWGWKGKHLLSYFSRSGCPSLFLFLCLFGDKISHSPGYPQTSYVAEVDYSWSSGLHLQVLGLQASAPAVGIMYISLYTLVGPPHTLIFLDVEIEDSRIETTCQRLHCFMSVGFDSRDESQGPDTLSLGFMFRP